MFHMKQSAPQKQLNSNLVWILTAAAAFGLVAILPYRLALNAQQLTSYLILHLLFAL